MKKRCGRGTLLAELKRSARAERFLISDVWCCSAVRPVRCAGSGLVVLAFEQDVERGE